MIFIFLAFLDISRTATLRTEMMKRTNEQWSLKKKFVENGLLNDAEFFLNLESKLEWSSLIDKIKLWARNSEKF